MDDHADTFRTTNEADVGRPTVVVCGHVGTGRSNIGLEIARRLHRPYHDIANAGIASETRPPLDRDSRRERAERHWVETMIRSAVGHVIVAPCTTLDVITDGSTGARTWTAWLDLDTDQLVRAAQELAPDIDVDAFRRHIRETQPLRSGCDEVIDTTGVAADVVAERLSERCRAATTSGMNSGGVRNGR